VGEETWNRARLIPTSGINGEQEQERRATSALLAVLMSVKEFGRAITQPLGAPAGRVETFIEVPFTLGEQQLFPDGLIRVTRGSRVWTALVEVKTGTNPLRADQLENYLDIAKENGFDTVLTVSNEFCLPDGSHPTKVDGRKTRKVALRHLSWMNILTEAVGKEVTPVLSRSERAHAAVRVQNLAGTLTQDGTMTGGVSIPGAIAHIAVTADLRAAQVICHIDIDAPREGRSQTRVNWLLRQLRDAPDSLRIEAFVMHGRGDGASELLGSVRDNPALLVSDPAKEIRSFRIACNAPMGAKRGRGRGGFIDSVTTAVNSFYADVVQHLRAWQPTAPKLRELSPAQTGEEQVQATLVSTALSSQDGAEPTDPEGPQTDLAKRRVVGDTLDAFIDRNGSRWIREPAAVRP